MPHRMANSRGHGKRQRHDDIDKRGFAGDSRQRESGSRPPKRPRFHGPGGGWQEEGQVSQSRSFDSPTHSHGAPFGSAGLHQQDQWEQVPQSYSSGRVPMEVSVLKFAQCRARELEALSQAAEHVGGTKLSFQRLPRHMRRRAMSHNIRRIPCRLRLKAQAELERREKKGKSKRPSRRHRRRPSNLLSEYQRRQRNSAWLETHIWHAKRFKMTTVWGYRLPLHPSDKSLRACYRATTYHCLLQDVSYECCIEVQGNRQTIIEALSHLCSKDTGLTFAAKATGSGQRWGTVMLYTCDAYPRGAVAPVSYLWQPDTGQSSNDGSAELKEEGGGMKEGGMEEKRVLWLWTHPASYTAVWTQVTSACALAPSAHHSDDSISTSEQKDPVCEDSKVLQSPEPMNVLRFGSPPGGTEACAGALHVRSLKDQLVKFRLTGPASNLVLGESLRPASITPAQASPQTGSGDAQESGPKPWWQNYYAAEEKASHLLAQQASYERVMNCQSPGEIPPRAVIALTVRDPRVLLPSKRAKVDLHEADCAGEAVTWEHLPTVTAVSPLWDRDIRDEVTKTKMTEQEMHKHRAQLLVPGSALKLGDKESRIPILLLQRPGCQSSSSRETATVRSGVGSGWDLVVPKGWGMAFWIAMVYRGARVGGLREARSLATRSGQLHFPNDYPDSAAGRQQQQESRNQCIDVHVRRPPAKRVSYHRLGVPAPFHCPFTQLVAEWQEKAPQVWNTVEQVETVKGVDSNKTVPRLGPALDRNFHSNESQCSEGGSLEDVGGGIVSGGGDGGKIDAPCPEMYVLRCRRLLRMLQDAVQSAAPKRKPSCKGVQRQVSTRLSTFLNQPQCRSLVSENLCSLVPIASCCLLRGVPSKRAMICLPSAADLKHLAKDSSFGGPIEHLHPRCRTRTEKAKEKKGKRTVVLASDVTAAGDGKQKQARETDTSAADVGTKTKDSKKSLNIKQLEAKGLLLKEPARVVDATDRPVIGFLTDGDFDLGQGRGSGVGFCSLVGLLSALAGVGTNEPLLVLLRNPLSRQYRFAHLSVSL